MKILVLCDQGNNRSVTLAGQLKYLGNDVLTAGIDTNSPSTLWKLIDEWADLIIVTANDQLKRLSELSAASTKGVIHHFDLLELWDLGPDNYPRPYNKELLAKVKKLIEEHPEVDQRHTSP